MEMRKTLSAALAAALFPAAFFGLQRLLTPKYMSVPFEGGLIREYYAEKQNHSLIVIGDCEVYENISPVTLWEEYGVSSYIRGSAQQLMWHSYAILEDTLRHETPQAVLLSVLCMIYGEPQNEAYNRMALDGLPLSKAKLDAARASMLPGETLLSYVFPILRFHSRWSELSREDLRYYFAGARRQLSINGFVMRCDVKAADEPPGAPLLPNYGFSEMAWEYLGKITALCEERGVQLLLYKAPSLAPHWYDEWDRAIADYARKRGLPYLNALEKIGEIGLDFQADTYDAGLHLNLRGAEKMSRYLGGWLRQSCPALEDRRGNAALSGVWAVKTAQYRAMRAAQEREIAEDGAVKTFFVPKVDAG
jgi:hypothetical protein